MSRWKAAGEEGLLRRIRRIFPAPGPEVRVPIGDDAALIRFSRTQDLAFTTDQMVEGVHFRRTTHPPELLGARALTVNLSDLASLGAVPRWFLLSLFLPSDLAGGYLRGILVGMAREARRRKVFLVGGNLTLAPALAIDICLAGSLPPGGRPLLRSGARPGDRLYVSGPLGGSALGLRLLKQGWRWKRGRAVRRKASSRLADPATQALRAHLAPAPDYALATLLSDKRIASAAIDISDGLSLDLARLCRASRVGARLEEGRLPLHPAAVRLCGKDRALELALHGGEEYRLLFTLPASEERRLLKLTLRRPPKLIGTVVPPGEGISLMGETGRIRPLKPAGYDHLLRRG